MIEGTVVGGRYAITRLLGEGGMGCVYEARHLGTGRRVALKVIAAELVTNASVVARLEAEAQAAGSIDSEHITQVVDVGKDEQSGTPFLVMELLDGEDLGELLHRLGPLDPALVARLGVQIGLGLEAAHGKSIVHRDLKPANIFLSRRDGGEVKVKILDFGISKSLDVDAGRPPSNKLTKTGTIMGSPVYMSPEQTRAKNIDHRSDLWSFGVVLYELLTNATPFDASGAIADLIIEICTGRIPPVTERAPWTPPALAAVVDRALVRDASARWQTAHEMRVALEACLPELRPIRMGDLVAANKPPVSRPSASRAGAETGVATPVHASVLPSTPVGAASAARGTAIVSSPRPVATVAFDPSKDARPSTTTAGVIAPPPGAVTPAKKGSPIVWIAGVAVVAGLGIGGFMLTRPSASSGTATSTADTNTAGTTPSAAGSTPRVASATPSAPPSAAPSSTAPPADPKLAALVGKWTSSKGNHFEGVIAGDTVELRVVDPKELVGKGYAVGEPRFVLRASSDGYTVTDHSRLKPLGTATYAGDVGPASCAVDVTLGDGKPLTAKLDGDKLSIVTARVTVVESVFVRKGNVVESCSGLDKINAGRDEVVYTREK